MKAKITIAVTLAILIAAISAAPSAALSIGELTGVWYLEGICKEDSCLKPYETGVYVEIDIREDKTITLTSNIDNSADKLEWYIENGYAYVKYEDSTPQRMTINSDGYLAMQDGEYVSIYAREHAPIPGVSKINKEADKKDYIGKWKSISVLNNFDKSSGEKTAFSISAEKMNIADELTIDEKYLDITLLGNPFTNQLYLVEDGSLYANIGLPGIGDGIDIIMRLHEDGYLVETINPYTDSELTIVFQRSEK